MPFEITYRNDGDWGTGYGNKIPSLKIDESFWSIHLRLTEMEENPPEPDEIVNATMSGDQLSFYRQSGYQIGPVTVPRGPFKPATTRHRQVATDGTYALIAADVNSYLRFLEPVTVLIGSEIGMLPDSEVYFRQVGDDPIEFEWPTDVIVNVPYGFLPQSGGPGCSVSLKFIAASGENPEQWDMDGVLAPNVTA